jgi:hypothetical protein
MCYCLLTIAANAEIHTTQLHLQPTDVLPTGNEWISLPDIRASDGALGTFNVLSIQHRGLLQVAGAAGFASHHAFVYGRWQINIVAQSRLDTDLP